MKVFIVLSVVAVCALAKPTTTVFTHGVPLTYAASPLAYAATPLAYAAPVAVSSQFHAQDELGQYNYGYSSGLSSKVESKSIDGVTRGGYSYVDAEGKVQNVQYTADSINGFRVAASNLPVGPAPIKPVEAELPKPVVDTPEVAAAKIQHSAAIEEAKARNAVVEKVEVIAAPAVVAKAVPVQQIVPAVAAVKYAAPGAFSYGYTASEPIVYSASHQFVGSPLAYAAAPVAYPSAYSYHVPAIYNYNVIPKIEAPKVEEIKA